MVEIATWSIVVFGLVHNLWAIGNVIWSLSYLQHTSWSASPAQLGQKFVILIPVFEEKRVVRATIQHFAKLEYPSEYFHVVLVGSARESGTDGETTSTVINKALDEFRLPNFHSFTADGNDRCKADQLNQAIARLAEKNASWWSDDVIVAVYDADSRPDYVSLQNVANAAARHPNVNVFQQPSLYLNNFGSVPRGFFRRMLQSRPLYNLRFCLYRELPGYYRSLMAGRMKAGIFSSLLRSPNHLLGHGEFVRRRVLEAIGGFPPPSGDTSLGTVLSFMREPIYPLSTFDYAETPEKPGMLAFQGANWYAGCALYTRDLKIALNTGQSLSATDLIMCFKRWLENMIWCLGPILWLLASVVLVLSQQFTAAALSLCVPGLHGICLILVAIGATTHSKNSPVNADQPGVKATDLLATLPWYPLMLLFACSGPLMYYFFRLTSFARGTDLPRWKTIRDV